MDSIGEGMTVSRVTGKLKAGCEMGGGRPGKRWRVCSKGARVWLDGMPSGRCRGPVQRDQTVEEFQWRQTELGDDYSVEESMDFGKEATVPRCIIVLVPQISSV